MLIPLSFDREYVRTPVATIALIVVNVVIFACTGTITETTLAELRPYALDPEAFRHWQLLTSVFLHADVVHLIVNMIVLWVFGRYLEDRVGAIRFVVLYLLFGVAGGLLYLWRGALPILGASGAISGLTAVVLFAAPRAYIPVRHYFFFLFPMNRRWHLPAWLLVGSWLAGDLLDLRHAGAALAHVGGFLAGIAAQVVLRQPVFEGTGWYLPREAHGGDNLSERERANQAAEVTYRMIDEHLAREKQRDDDEPPVYDIMPDSR